MSDIKQNVVDMAAKLKTELSLGDNGVFSGPADIYQKTLNDDVTLDMVEKVQNHTSDFVSAMGLALGELSIEAMKKDKKLEQTSFECAAGKDSVGGVFQRSKEVSAGLGAAAGTKTNYGVLSMKVQVNAHANKGTLKKVRNRLAEEAKRVLG